MNILNPFKIIMQYHIPTGKTYYSEKMFLDYVYHLQTLTLDLSLKVSHCSLYSFMT